MNTRLFASRRRRLRSWLPFPRPKRVRKTTSLGPLQTEVKSGTGGEVAVRLVQKSDGKPVANAVIFRSRLDMSPEEMGDMTAKLTAEPSSEPGVYRFKAEPTMAGRWALKLMAKVPGESETVEGTVIITAKD